MLGREARLKMCRMSGVCAGDLHVSRPCLGQSLHSERMEIVQPGLRRQVHRAKCNVSSMPKLARHPANFNAAPLPRVGRFGIHQL